MRRWCRERFPRHRGLAIPTCITPRESRTCRDAPESLSSSFLWSRWWVNVPGIPSACAIRNFTYLIRGPFTRTPWLTTANGHVFVMAAVVITPLVTIAIPQIGFIAVTLHVIQEDRARAFPECVRYNHSTFEPHHLTGHLSIYIFKGIITHRAPAVRIAVYFQTALEMVFTANKASWEREYMHSF